MSTCLAPSWQAVLEDEFKADYMQTLRQFVRGQKDVRKIIYPKSADVFKAWKKSKW